MGLLLQVERFDYFVSPILPIMPSLVNIPGPGRPQIYLQGWTGFRADLCSWHVAIACMSPILFILSILSIPVNIPIPVDRWFITGMNRIDRIWNSQSQNPPHHPHPC